MRLPRSPAGLLAALAVLALPVLFVGCGDDKGGSASTAAGGGEAEASQPAPAAVPTAPPPAQGSAQAGDAAAAAKPKAATDPAVQACRERALAMLAKQPAPARDREGNLVKQPSLEQRRAALLSSCEHQPVPREGESASTVQKIRRGGPSRSSQRDEPPPPKPEPSSRG
jgi:hypothetical protein